VRAFVAFALIATSVAFPQPRDTAECLTIGLYHAFAFQGAAKGECCGECGGKGVVLSGDGISWVACPCPDDCECKRDLVTHPPTVINGETKSKSSSCPDGRCKL